MLLLTHRRTCATPETQRLLRVEYADYLRGADAAATPMGDHA